MNARFEMKNGSHLVKHKDFHFFLLFSLLNFYLQQIKDGKGTI